MKATMQADPHPFVMIASSWELKTTGEELHPVCGLELLSVTERSSLFPELLADLVHATSAARESFTMESKTRGIRGEWIPIGSLP